MATAVTVILAAIVVTCLAQRPSYAGRFPIGYPELETTSTTTSADELGNRFGEDVTTERLPIEANGDRELVNRLKKLPLDKQPFWLINWLALEELRKNPQTYPHKENTFIDFIPTNQNSVNNQNNPSF